MDKEIFHKLLLEVLDIPGWVALYMELKEGKSKQAVADLLHEHKPGLFGLRRNDHSEWIQLLSHLTADEHKQIDTLLASMTEPERNIFRSVILKLIVGPTKKTDKDGKVSEISHDDLSKSDARVRILKQIAKVVKDAPSVDDAKARLVVEGFLPHNSSAHALLEWVEKVLCWVFGVSKVGDITPALLEAKVCAVAGPVGARVRIFATRLSPTGPARPINVNPFEGVFPMLWQRQQFRILVATIVGLTLFAIVTT